ncbi:BatD family protein [Dysgonomonas sp. OttesenSCG-928-M03]|nr:BatD family protein [Dysgonomonas sp. OttesenSCG-928-M03]
MRKELLLIVFLFLGLSYLGAQEVTFRASAPAAVAKGETFRLVYTLQNAEGEGPIQAASSINGFEILFGPATSSSHSTTIINGKAESSSSESYIYTLSAEKEGSFTIPAATVKANGKTYTSNTLQIKVLPPDKNAQAQQQGQRGGATSSSSSTTGNISSTDAFIRAIVSKTKIREQEAFVVTFRFYTTLDVRDIGKIEFPEFDGFMVEDQDLPGARQLAMEHYNGRNYYAVDLRRTLLFPQRSGQITIPQGKIEMIFNVRSGKTVDTFFGPQYVMTDVKKTLTTSPLNINVSPLPAGKPATFSNGVGNFTITPSISATDIKANDAVTLKLVISGTGNMKLIKTPELNLPKDFETYDPKITNNLKFTDNGLTGSKTIEYLFIPRYQGTYKIAPVELSYFDTRSNSYKTLTTPEYTLNVAKDPNAKSASATSFTQTDVEVEQDIRYIKTGKPSFVKIDSFLVGSAVYYLWYIIPLLLFVAYFVLNRKKIKENADIVKTKTKRANKVAVKRLKEAQKYLQAQQKEKFYEEVLRATWGYLSDKLSIPVANLNRDNVENELVQYGARPELIERFMYILDTCEFARYAPAESDTAMDELYQSTVSAIGEMENSKIKK